MNERNHYQAKIAWQSVLLVISATLALVPGIDPDGRAILGVFAAFLLILLFLSIRRLKRASAQTAIFTPLTLHAAPVDFQLKFWRRARWIAPGAMLFLTAMAAVDFQQLETGESNSIRLVIPFNFVYQAFGATATLVSMVASSAGLFLLIQWLMPRLVGQTPAEDKIKPPPSN